MLGVLAAAGAAGCEREPTPATTNGATPTASTAHHARALSPTEAVRELNAARWRGQHGVMQSLIVPEQRDAVMALVLAVDQLIAAEDALQQAMRTAIGEGSAEHFRRRRQVANIIGPLSRDVEIVSEHVENGRAEVMIQVASRVPLERVELVQSGDGWQVRTDEPIPGLADALIELAAVTRRFAADVGRGRYDAQSLDRELTLRQTPILRRMAQLTAAARQTASPDAAP